MNNAYTIKRCLLFYFVLFIFMALYAFSFSFGFLSHVAAIVFSLASICFIFYPTRFVTNWKMLILIPVVIQLGVFAGATCGSMSFEQLFFTPDSYTNFLSKSEILLDWITGRQKFVSDNLWDYHFLIFDFINAPIILLVKRNPTILMMSISFYVMGGAYLIFKIIMDFFEEIPLDKRTKYAVLASSVFLFNPTFFLHHSLFIKESFLQLLFGFLLWFFLKFQKHFRLRDCLGLCLVGILLTWERIYFVLPSLVFIIPSLKKYKFYLLGMGISLFGVGFFYFGSNYFVEKWKFAIVLLNAGCDVLKLTKINYSVLFGDVNKQYLAVPYPFQFLKLLFSPFFSVNKFSLFTQGFSPLIIWGAIINWVILLLSYFGFFFLIKKQRCFIAVVLAYIVYVAFLAWIAPYGFRQRDLFAPFLSITCSYCIFTLIESNTLRLLPRKNNA